MLRFLVALNLLVFLLCLDGIVSGQVRNAVAQSSAEVTVQSLAGKWAGGGSAGQTVTMTINEDGTYRSIVWIMSGQESANTGRIFVQDGRLRFRNQLGTSGTLTVGVENGERVIRGTFDGRSDTYLLRQARKDESGAADTLGVSWTIAESYWPGGGKDVCSTSGSKRESSWSLSITLVGKADTSIDPTQDDLVRKVLVAGREWAIRNCPPAQNPGARYFYISLYSPRYRNGREPFVFSKGVDPAAANFRFDNRAAEEAKALARQREEDAARQKAQADADAQRRAIQAQAQAKIGERLGKIEAFKRRSRVDVWLTGSDVQSFTSNPFPWKGKTVGFIAEFGVMRSENSGIFAIGESNYVVISNIPATRFTRTGQRAMIAGRVQGVTQATLPMLGTLPVPEVVLSAAENPPD